MEGEIVLVRVGQAKGQKRPIAPQQLHGQVQRFHLTYRFNYQIRTLAVRYGLYARATSVALPWMVCVAFILVETFRRSGRRSTAINRATPKCRNRAVNN